MATDFYNETILINAFGVTREVAAHRMLDGDFSTEPVFAAKFATGAKVHRVNVRVGDKTPKDEAGAFIVKARSVTTLNKTAWLFGWFEGKFEAFKSQHIGSR